MTTQAEMITSPQAGQILGCSARTVVRLVRRGKLTPAMRLDTGPNGAYLFNRADIEKLAIAAKLGKPKTDIPLSGLDVHGGKTDAA